MSQDQRPAHVIPLNTKIALEEMQTLITPNPAHAKHCRQPTCGGKRGWYGINIFEARDGTVNAQLLLCCGRIGGSEYERVMQTLGGKIDTVQAEVDRLVLLTTGVNNLTAQVKDAVESLTDRHRFLRKVKEESIHAE